VKLYRAVTPKAAYDILARSDWTDDAHPEHPGDPRRGVLLYPHPPLAASLPPDVDIILEVEFEAHDTFDGFLWDDEDEAAGYMLPALFIRGWGITRALPTRTVRAAARRIVAAYRKELRLLKVKSKEAREQAAVVEAVLRRWEEADGTFNGLTLAKIRP
jgi:hypothetical protein